MRLTPGKSEPADYQLLALCRGGPNELGAFARYWMSAEGHTGIRIASSASAGGHALWLGRVKVYGIVQWLLSNFPQWRLFYSALPPACAVPRESNPSLGPTGVFAPWGQCIEGDCSEPGILNDGANFVPLSNVTFCNFLEDNIAIETNLNPLSATQCGASDPFPLPLTLRKSAAPDPHSIEARVRRLEGEKERIEMQLMVSRSQLEESTAPAVKMYIYPETNTPHNPAWRLRHWFVETPGTTLDRFLHARVEVPGLAPMHLVIPNAESESAPVNVLLPPTPLAYTLSLDWHWRKKGLRAFVSDGFELTPHPPQENAPLFDLMANCLWAGALRDTLIVLYQDGNPVRFTVSEFKPLRTQSEQLNFRVTRLKDHNSANADLDSLLTQIRHAISAQLDGHAKAMHQTLLDLWSGKRADIATHRDLVTDLLNEVDRIREWEQDLASFDSRTWATWKQFCADVDELTVRVVPTKDYRMARAMRALTDLRRQFIEVASTKAPGRGEAVAKGLTDLAATIKTL